MATNLANLDAGGSVNSNAQAHELIQLVQRCHANVPELTMGLAIEPEDKQCPGLYSKGCTGELIQTVNGETGQPIWKCHMSVETYGRYDSGVASTAAERFDRKAASWADSGFHFGFLTHGPHI